ncbi:hypothetical protein C9374_008970 [Naegleria lovaniensis]|uniref:Myb-like domain-containing protein n=1 Tax=Naegleria lovaniensis TaxID=51637 RepID=A0AA88GJE1_NAELO|nr:uncharacterized protein C9374_008970 [Naegleria lovaniensis]KAG2377885.1 hypothetical protein C9374_008970 [Naegleria lovaniensis]
MDCVVELAALEIALEGLRGCSFDRLVTLMQEYHPDIVMDEDMQRAVWMNLLRCPKLLIYRVSDNTSDETTGDASAPSTSKTQKNKKAPQKNDYQYTTEGFAEYAESKNGFDKRFAKKRDFIQDVTTIHQSLETSFNSRNYSDICLVGNFEYRKYALGMDVRSDVEISEIQFCLLEEVGRSRYTGKYQSDLTKYLNIDSRSTLYHLKRLYGLNLMFKKSAYDPRLKTNSNLVRLFRFADAKKQQLFVKKTSEVVQAEGMYEKFSQVKDSVVDTVVGMLQKAKGNVLIDYEIRKKLLDFIEDDTTQKHKWDRLKAILQASGKVEYFKAMVDNRLTYCVRLVGDAQNLTNRSSARQVDLSEDERLLMPGFDMERPQLYQMFDYIGKMGGNNGLIHNEIYQHFMMTAKLSGNLCNDLRKEFGVTSMAEKSDKQMTYRFVVPYSSENISHDTTSVEGHTSKADVDKEPQVLFPTRLNITTKPRKRNQREKIDEEVASDYSETSSQQSDEDIEEIDTKSTTSENVTAPVPTPYIRNNSKTEGPRKEVITKEFSDRCKLALEFIKEKQCVARFQLIEHFKQNNTSYESKTMSRLIRYLENNKLAKKIHITVPNLFGTTTKEHVCLIDYSLDLQSDVVQEFTKSLYSSEVQTNSKEKVDRSTLESFEAIDHIEPKKAAKRSSNTSSFHLLLNGYINAKMVRVKIFHKYLWKQAFTGAINCERLRLFDIYKNMSVLLFCELVGCISSVIVTPENKGILQNTTINDAQEDIKKAIESSVVGRRSVALSKVEQFIDILNKLGLVEILPEESASKVFNLVKTVEFPFPQQLPSTEYRKVTFNTLDDIDEYWDDLEMCSINMENIRNENDDDQQTETSIFSKIPDLGKRTGWSELRHFTLRHLRILEASYKDNKRPSPEECSSIAKQLRHPIEQVILYFYRYRTEILTNRIDGDSSIRNSRKRRIAKDNDFIVNDDEIEYEDEQTGNKGESNKQQKSTATRLGYVSRLFIDKASETVKRKKRKKKPKEKTLPTRDQKWTSDQDLKLLDGLSKVRELDPATGTFLTKPIKWQQIADSIGGGMTANRCRLRWTNVLRKLPWCRRALELAVGHRELMKSNPHIENISITDLVQSCKDQYKMGSTVSQSPLLNIDLPKHIEDVNRHFKIIRFEGIKNEDLPSTDVSENIVSIESHLRNASLENLFKIILLTPDECYDVKMANRLVKRFKPKEISQCFSNLRKKSIISKSKRGLRMKGYHLNVNFSTRMTSAYFPTEVFEDAPKFKKAALMLDTEQDSDNEDEFEAKQVIFSKDGPCFNPQASGGSVAACMSLVILNEIKLVPQVTPLTDEERNQSGRNDKELAEEDGGGVSNHLLRVGAIRHGEHDSHFIAEGMNIKSSQGALQLPEWNISITPVIEADLFNTLGEEHQTLAKRTIAEYGAIMSDIEYSIELSGQNKRKLDDFSEDDDQEENPLKKQKDDHAPTQSEITAYLQTFAAQHSLPRQFSEQDLHVLENLEHQQLKPIVEYLLMAKHENCTFWIDSTISIYKFIADKSSVGASMNELKKEFSSLFAYDDEVEFSIQEIVQQLINFDCIMEINSEEESRFMISQEARLHTIPYNDNGVTLQRPISVFLQLNGELNDNLLQNFKRCLVSRIMRHPGILEKSLISSIGVISSHDIRTVLKMLESENIITSTYFQASSKYKLASKNTLFMTEEEIEEHHCEPQYDRALFVTPRYVFLAQQSLC